VIHLHEPNPGIASDENTIRYPGWGIATAAFVGVMTSFSPIVPYTFSLFLNPLHAAFGWKREAMGGTFAIAAITVALVSPFIGMLLDRFPPRRIILPSIVVFALALASLSRLHGNIGQFYLTFFLLGVVANGTAQFAYTRTILTWFHKHRGLALALILTGSGVGSILIPPPRNGPSDITAGVMHTCCWVGLPCWDYHSRHCLFATVQPRRRSTSRLSRV